MYYQVWERLQFPNIHENSQLLRRDQPKDTRVTALRPVKSRAVKANAKKSSMQSEETNQSPAAANQAVCTRQNPEEWLSTAKRRNDIGGTKRDSREQDKLPNVKECYVMLQVPAEPRYVNTACVLLISYFQSYYTFNSCLLWFCASAGGLIVKMDKVQC
jgi:hypothetical protein